MDSIYITFNQTIKQANLLNEQADNLRDLAKQLASIMSELHLGWQGENASLYLQKCEVFAEKVKRTASDLDRIADIIKKAAKSYYDAEQKALEAVKTNRLYRDDGF